MELSELFTRYETLKKEYDMLEQDIKAEVLKREKRIKYRSLLNKGDAIVARFPERRAAWQRFKESDAVNEVKLVVAMVEHLAEYERRMLLILAEGAKEFAALRRN
jgi:hypothetical protein